MYIHVLYAKFVKVLKVYWGTIQGFKFFCYKQAYPVYLFEKKRICIAKSNRVME